MDHAVFVSADGGNAGNLRAAGTNYGSGHCGKPAQALSQAGGLRVGVAAVCGEYIQSGSGHFRDGGCDTTGSRGIAERLRGAVGGDIAAASDVRTLQEIRAVFEV